MLVTLLSTLAGCDLSSHHDLRGAMSDAEAALWVKEALKLHDKVAPIVMKSRMERLGGLPPGAEGIWSGSAPEDKGEIGPFSPERLFDEFQRTPRSVMASHMVAEWIFKVMAMDLREYRGAMEKSGHPLSSEDFMRILSAASRLNDKINAHNFALLAEADRKEGYRTETARILGLDGGGPN